MSETSHIELPKSWTTTRLDQLGEWAGGGTPSKANEAFWNGGSIPWVSPKDMKSFEIHDTEDHITEQAVDSSATTILPTGTVLVVTRSGILRHTLPVAVTRVPVTLNQDLKALTPYTGLCSDYIAYALRAFSQQVLHLCVKGGTTVQSVEFPSLKRFEIPIAPAQEQIRIVDKLNELLPDLDAGVASLAVVKMKLEHYRAAVLKAAVEGSLTAEWRRQNPDTEPASELLKRILTERRRSWEEEQLRKYAEAGKELPKNWEVKYREPISPDISKVPHIPEGWGVASVDALITESIINGISVRGSNEPPGVPSLRLDAMTEAGFNYGAKRYLPLTETDVEGLWIEAGDFFVSRGNGSKKLVGRGTVAQPPPAPTIFPDTMMRLRLSYLLRATRWVSTIWSSGLVRSQIEKVAKTTAGIWKIAQPDVAGIMIPIPPLEEQQAIVEIVEGQLSIIEHTETVLNTRMKSAQSLRQSILRHAFTGQLVRQDPNDEPACELLEHIAAERGDRERQTAAAKRGITKQRRSRERANGAS